LPILEERRASDRALEEAATVIVQLVMGFLSDLVFESATSRQRSLYRELDRYLGRKPETPRSTPTR
jgi:hypothetical protein